MKNSILILLTFLSFSVSAQKTKFFTGGGIGASFGNFTYVNVSPIFGYRFHEKFIAGMGINYQYLKHFNSSQAFQNYGGRVFGNYFFIPELYATAEVGLMNFQYYERTQLRRDWFTAILAGLGYSQELGSNARFNVEVLWNLNNSPIYPINIPIIRGGIIIGI